MAAHNAMVYATEAHLFEEVPDYGTFKSYRCVRCSSTQRQPHTHDCNAFRAKAAALAAKAADKAEKAAAKQAEKDAKRAEKAAQKAAKPPKAPKRQRGGQGPGGQPLPKRQRPANEEGVDAPPPSSPAPAALLGSPQPRRSREDQHLSLIHISEPTRPY